MRKIEEKIIKAMKDRRTYVRLSKRDEVYNGTYSLHGHCIFVEDWTKKELSLSACGWLTVTTKSRLNALLQAYGFEKIYQKKGVWYWPKEDRVEESLHFYKLP